ncbi:MAG: glycosyltransferase family 39 protein [Anaerolineae bacterium]
MKNVKAWLKFILNRPAIRLCLILAVYCALLLPTVSRQGISWDEQTDLDITRAYLKPGGWLRGSDSDPSQTRLPMAAVAAVYALLRTDDLLTARLVSCLVGALTIIGVYVFCKRDFDSKTGLLAGAMLATSPFFLSFAKTAFTETDIYVACAVVWLLVATSRLRESGTPGRAAVTAVVLGLALSAKFTTVVIFPAIVFYILAENEPRRHREHGEQAENLFDTRKSITSRKLWPVSDRVTTETTAGTLRDRPAQNSNANPTIRLTTTRLTPRELRNGIALLALMSAAILFGWLDLNSMAPEWRDEALLRLHFILALGGWIAVLVWAWRHRHKRVAPWLIAGFVLALALGTTMVVPPEHLTNPQIINSLIDRFENEMQWSPAFMGEAAALHLACVLFKSSPLLGAGLLISLFTAALQWKARSEVRLLLLIVGCYFLGLVLLPLAQTFYMMPVLPILAILAADQWFTLMARKKPLAMGMGAVAVVMLCVDLVLCYPDFNMNGYQWVGARYIGNRATLGYRSIVQTPSDGVEQTVRWVSEHARPGDRVVVYAYPWHIVEAAGRNSEVRFTRGQYNSVRLRPDYVIVHINHTIRQSWAAYFTGEVNTTRGDNIFWEPYDAEWLHNHYTKVATVPRAFGIEMASVWERTDRLKAK